MKTPRVTLKSGLTGQVVRVSAKRAALMLRTVYWVLVA